MSTPSENQEIEFAWALRRALDERAAQLAPATTKRLAAARHAALARKKPEPEMAVAPVFAVAGMGGLADGMFAPAPQRAPGSSRRSFWSPLSNFFSRFALTWPCIALVAGIFLIAHWENQQRAAELADIDAAMLSDDLPLHAYLDHGFNAYLSRAR